MNYLYYLLAYIIGSISFSYLLVKIFKNEDVRNKGSKNAGGTNVIRIYGWKLGLPVAILDIFIGVFVTFIFKKYDLGYPVVALFFAVLGHCYPIFMKFKGGKGIATTAGGFIFLFINIFPFGLAVFAGLAVLTGYVSVASIFMVFTSGILIIYTYALDKLEIVAIAGIILLAIIRHNSNIKRLIRREENQFRIGGK